MGRNPISEELMESFITKVAPVVSNPQPGRVIARTAQPTQFIGHPKPGMKVNRHGEFEITFAIPYEYRDAAYLVVESMEMPVVVTVTPWDGQLIDD